MIIKRLFTSSHYDDPNFWYKKLFNYLIKHIYDQDNFEINLRQVKECYDGSLFVQLFIMANKNSE